MSSDAKLHHWLADIVENGEDILRWSDGMSYDAFLADKRNRYAIERGLLIVTEAAARISKSRVRRPPDIPWDSIARLGNALRHEYDRLNRPALYRIVTADLPALVAACRAYLDRHAPDELA